jgi:hypothetical protein
MGGAAAAEVTAGLGGAKTLTSRPFSANLIGWLVEHDTSPQAAGGLDIRAIRAAVG